MIFTKSQIPNALKIPFNWVADYFDGTYLSEYNFSNGQPNSFYSIKQTQAIRFGLIGQGMKFFFESSDGSFNLNGRRIDIAYEVDGKQYFLTNNALKKDFITYKQAHTNFNNKSGIQRSNLDSIDFGYKALYKKDDIEMFFQPIVSLPFNSSVCMEVKLTSDRNLNGDIVFYSRNKEVQRFHAPLEAYVSGQINWTVK
ncbi:hypothetical protein ABE073_03815 [Lederbergia citrisecunda]|uniref:hypothetical protein n=1 Tax=Lederbergia citrisecunda TaxID=2833583 RepID=UPI003D2CAE3B